MDPVAGNEKARKLLDVATPFLVGFLCILYLASISSHWKPDWDCAYLLTLGKSLLNGQGLTYMGQPCLNYPFIFPLVLSVFLRFFGNQFLAINIFMAMLALVSLWVIYRHFRLTCSKQYAVLISFLTGTSYLMIFYSGYILSDLPYLIFAILTLTFGHKFINGQPGRLSDGITAGLCLTAAYFTRTAGVTLIPAFLAAVLFRGAWRGRIKQLAIVALVIVIPVFAWRFRDKSLSSYYNDPVWRQLQEFVTYKDMILQSVHDSPDFRGGVVKIIKHGLVSGVFYAGQTSMTLLAKQVRVHMTDVASVPKPLLLVLAATAFAVALGWLLKITRRWDFAEFYVLFYIGMLLLWAVRYDRYLLPILPFLFHYFLIGLAWMCSRVEKIFARFSWAKRISPFALTAAVGYMTVANLIDDVAVIRSQHAEPYYDADMGHLLDAAAWIKDQTKPDARIVSVWAPIVGYFGQRWCISYPETTNNVVILKTLDKLQAQFLVVSPISTHSEELLIPMVKENSPIFRPLYQKDSTVIYEIDRPRLRDLASHTPDPPFAPVTYR
jgi:hypothetical protein